MLCYVGYGAASCYGYVFIHVWNLSILTVLLGFAM